MALSAGARIGAYEIVAPLGEGGMGEVYRARDRRLGREVAIKCLPEAFAADPDRVMRFEREARTLASLNHLHIAQVYGLEDASSTDPGHAGPTRALVMELVEGEDLSVRIARGAIPVDEALPIARQIAEALEAAHALGIVHRDLKPGNIKLKDDGTVKVLDFGLAKAIEGTSGARAGEQLLNSPTITSPALTMGGVILGTAAYMAPEQAKGKFVDKRADIWAFGCVLYEMLTGRRAFDGEDVSDTLAAILRSDPDWAALPSLPPALTLLLKRCLERDWRRRVSDMAAVRFVLEDLGALTPPSSEGPSAQEAREAPAQVQARVADAVAHARHQMRLRVVMPLLGLLVVTGAIASFAFVKGARTDTRPPVTRFVLPLPQGQVLSMSRRMTTLSPDGQSLAYVAEGQIFVRRLAQFEAETIPAVDLGQAISSPTFSPDGAWLAFHSGSQNTLKRVSTRGGAALRVCGVSLPLTIGWEASGILLGMGSGGVLRCDPGGGTPEQLVRAMDDELIISPQMLTGDAILFTSARAAVGASRWDTAEVVVQSLKTGTRRVVVSAGSDARYVRSGHLLYRYGGILYAVRFDPTTQEIHGEGLPVIEGIARASAGPTQMSVSAGGTIAYMPGPTGTSSGERQLTIGDRAGVTTRVSLPPGPFMDVRVSPDGKQVALGGDDGKDASVWVWAFDGRSALRRLTLTGRNRFPVWSPDGQWIAFQSVRGADRGIYRQRADGTGSPERLTTAAESEDHIPESWSPGGRHLSYVVQSKARAEFALWVLSLADGKASAFGGVKSIQPIGSVFSPDGRWIAYTQGGGDDISAADRGVFVQAFPATGTVFQAPRQLVDFHPMWSRDGKELVFLASTTARQMAAMQVSVNGSSLTFGAPKRFPASVTADKLSGDPRSFDMLPDGRLIGLVGPGEASGAGGLAELRVVMNWFEELAARVPMK